MGENKAWKLELEEYIRQGEPERVEKSNAWKTAIGLQAVDGLKTSKYLLETAREHIEGSIHIADAKRRIQSYYEQKKECGTDSDSTKEADLVSVHIAELLGEKTFQFSPATYRYIHKRLFTGVFDHAGQFRTYNIIKKEWILNGDTVFYAPYDSIRETLDYDFSQEKEFAYGNVSVPEAVRHVAGFASGIWQIHPFCEGNTRSIAVFIIKYLRTFGFQINNDVFAEYSWYFRNALVRANYNNLQKGIHATTEFLELFFENLLFDAHNELKNRFLHIDYENRDEIQSAKPDELKCQNGIFDGTLEEMIILRAIAANPAITQKQLAEKTGKSERTIKRRMVDLQEKGYLQRVNGKRNGQWKLNIVL